MTNLLTVIFLLSFLFGFGDFHGMLMDPINRASRWRIDPSAPKNYDDAGVWCGGAWTQHGINQGKCGICGDSYSDPRPRRHELGGTFGQGVLVKEYFPDVVIDVNVRVTVNHMGYFWFDLCNLDNEPEEEECFNKILTSKGEDKWYLPSKEAKDYEVQLKLPKDTCDHCILRWTYVAGNNWGTCENGTQGVGCGPQEHFRTCSDIAIRIANLKLDDLDGEIPESIEIIESNSIE